MPHPTNPAEGQGELDLKEGDVVYVLLDPQEPIQIGHSCWTDFGRKLP